MCKTKTNIFSGGGGGGGGVMVSVFFTGVGTAYDRRYNNKINVSFLGLTRKQQVCSATFNLI